MTQNSKGRVEEHMQGTGALTHANVEDRAREIAIINGGDGSNPTDHDRAQALQELQNETVRLSTDESTEEPLAAAPGTHFAADTGHKIKNRKPEDSQMIEETEIREGVREAEHNTMLTERNRKDPEP
jgi:hypothetical protein